MAPPFIFRVKEIQPHPRIGSQYFSNGLWLPPRLLGGNVVARGTQIHTFCFTGEAVFAIASLPTESLHYKTSSVYYHSEHFWVVPYDATIYQVHDGDEENISDSDQDDYDDDIDYENPVSDWAELSFNAVDGDDTYTSYVTCRGKYHRLLVQRTDQRWAQKLFPDRFHSHEELFPPRYVGRDYGGLVGELPLLLALIAFSVRPSEVPDTLAQCMNGHRWDCTQPTRGRGCK